MNPGNLCVTTEVTWIFVEEPDDFLDEGDVFLIPEGVTVIVTKGMKVVKGRSVFVTVVSSLGVGWALLDQLKELK